MDGTECIIEVAEVSNAGKVSNAVRWRVKDSASGLLGCGNWCGCQRGPEVVE